MTETRKNVVMQINMHPNDARHVVHTLPHQIRMWGAQVDGVVITLDLHRSRAGRYRNNDFEQNLQAITATLQDVARTAAIEVMEVNYAPAVRAEVAGLFFSTARIPDKAWDGGPFYSYFYGLWAADAD